MLQMGVPPVQIYVMSAISGVEWDEAWSAGVVGPLGSHRVRFLGRETFLRNSAPPVDPGTSRISMRSSPAPTRASAPEQ